MELSWQVRHLNTDKNNLSSIKVASCCLTIGSGREVQTSLQAFIMSYNKLLVVHKVLAGSVDTMCSACVLHAM